MWLSLSLYKEQQLIDGENIGLEATNNVTEEEEDQDEQSEEDHSDAENNGDEYEDFRFVYFYFQIKKGS